MLLDTSPHTDPPLHLMMLFARLAPDRQPDLIARLPERDLVIAVLMHAAEPLQTVRYTLQSAEMGGDAPVVFTWQSAKARRGQNGRPLARWAQYVAGAVAAVELPAGTPGGDGFTAAFSGGEPAGPRYEFAVGLLMTAVLASLHPDRARFTPAAVMSIAERVRREYVDG
jgi:hypothetical protein